jgi:hypothetical protein
VTTSAPDSPAPPHQGFQTITWAAFLACSWTWCIGMFLPVILMRDFGPLAFWAFAVPNIAGAAAMGVLLRAPGLSESIVARHAPMCTLFSIVTRAFQFFFLTWLAMKMAADSSVIVYLAAFLIGLLLAAHAYEWPRRARMGALAAWMFSTGLLLAAGAMGALRWPASPAPHSPDLLWLTPVMVFGFGLCPYLDLTFHFARQQARGGRGDRAFMLGFGALFAVMIAGTYAYAHLFTSPGYPFASDALLALPAILITLQIALQLGFTISLHDVGVERKTGRIRSQQGIGWGALGVALAVGQIWLPQLFGLDPGEVIYRGFMAFYGLVFPAYVWICMIPVRRAPASPTRSRLNLWAAAVGIAAPMYFMGFIVRETWWLAPGLGVVLAARLLVPRLNGPAAAASTA